MNLESLIPKENGWLHSNTILLGPFGSHANGTKTVTSDLDYKGVCIPPPDYFLGLKSFQGYEKSGGGNFKNKSGDIDISIIHIIKFVRDAMAGVPNNLALLFLEESDYVYVNEHFGHELISMRKHFLSKRIMEKMGSYKESQTQKIKQLKSNGKARMELVEKHGFDTKFYMHSVLSMEYAIEILLTGEMKTKRPNVDYLLSLKNGFHSLEEAISNLDRLDAKLQEAHRKSSLRERPDEDFINKWLTDFNIRYINQITQ